MSHVHLFISCVSDEFKSYREALRNDLTRPNVATKIQEDFKAAGAVTLDKLDDYIRNCDAVIHIAGDMTGSVANAPSLAFINERYKDFGERLPSLKDVLEGKEPLSYTQWEAYLAIYHGKILIIAKPEVDAERSDKFQSIPDQQANQYNHLSRLRKLGYYDEIAFRNEAELITGSSAVAACRSPPKSHTQKAHQLTLPQHGQAV